MVLVLVNMVMLLLLYKITMVSSYAVAKSYYNSTMYVPYKCNL